MGGARSPCNSTGAPECLLLATLVSLPPLALVEALPRCLPPPPSLLLKDHSADRSHYSLTSSLMKAFRLKPSPALLPTVLCSRPLHHSGHLRLAFAVDSHLPHGSLPGAQPAGCPHTGAATCLRGALEHELLHVARWTFDCLLISEGRDPRHLACHKGSRVCKWVAAPSEHSMGHLFHAEPPTGPAHPGGLFSAPRSRK